MQSTSDFIPFTELVIDVQRSLSICGNEQGGMFLASQEFIDAMLPTDASKASVIHIPATSYPYFRLPVPADDLTGPRDELLEFKRYVLNYGQGFYALRAAHSSDQNTWVLAGEVEWYSPLRIELARATDDMQ